MNELKRVLWSIVIVALCLAVPVGVLFVVFEFNNRPPSITVPTHSVPKDNGWNFFERAAEIMGKVKHWGPLSDADTKHVWTRREYESFLKDNAQVFSMIREGLKRNCVVPASRRYDDMMPIYARFREEARMLGSEAQYYEFIREPGKAMDSRLDCVEFSLDMQNGGTLIEGLV